MRNIQAFLLSLTICYGGKSCRVDAFNVATTEKRCSLIRRHVGISHDVPEDFALQNNNIATPPTRLTGDDVSDKSSKPAPSTLNPLEAAFTKYAMISYVAHMCVALPMVLLPTFIKNELMTRLNLKTKAESEDEALKVLADWDGSFDAPTTPAAETVASNARRLSRELELLSISDE